MENTNERKIIAETILQQLGGVSKVKAFTGAKTFLILEKEEGISFKFDIDAPRGKPTWIPYS